MTSSSSGSPEPSDADDLRSHPSERRGYLQSTKANPTTQEKNTTGQSSTEPETIDPETTGQGTHQVLPAAIDMDRQSTSEAFKTLQRWLHYSPGIPETLRSAGAYAGELVRESASWLVPSAFRNSQSYSVFVQQMLDYVGNDLLRGHASDSASSAPERQEQAAGNGGEDSNEQVMVARKTVGSLLDMTTLATFHLSPLLVLAVYSEVAYGTTEIMQQLGLRLKEQGIIPEKTKVADADSLLASLRQASRVAASTFEQPPLSIEGIEQTIQQTKVACLQAKPERLLPAAEIDQLWRQMELAARDQKASIWDVSATISIIALNNIQAIEDGGLVSLEIVGNMYQQQIIEHYWEGLRAIERHGLLPTLSRACKPYVETVWSNFAVSPKGWKEQLLNGELLKWRWSRLTWPKLVRR